MYLDDEDIIDNEDDEYEDDEEAEMAALANEETSTSTKKKTKKTKKQLDTKNKLRTTLEITDELILEMLNLIKANPDQYSQGHRFNFSTKTAIITEALRIGLRCIIDNNASLNSLIEDTLKRRTRVLTQMIADDFAKIHRDVTQIKLNQLEQKYLLKSIIQKEMSGDDATQLTNYRVEDLNNLTNKNVTSFLNSLKQELLTEEDLAQEKSLAERIKLVNK